MSADSERIEDGLSRRQVLARGAVAAGVIWAAPVIRTATAYATSAAGTERPCINFFVVACDALGIRPVRFGPDDRAYDSISAEAAASVSTTTSTSTSSTTSTTTTTTTTAPPVAAPAAPTSTTTSTTTTTTTTPPVTTGEPGGTTDTTKPGRDTTPTTQPAVPVLPAPNQDDFGLFSDPGATTPSPADPLAPPDPHQTLIDAALAAKAAGTPDVLPPGIKDWLTQNPDVPIGYPDALPMLTQSGDDAWAITLAAVDGPDPLTHQCRVVDGWAASKGKYEEFFFDPDPETLDEFGRRVIFPNPRADELAADPTALIESVIFVFCCPQ